jgi:hypothetical protein
VVGRSLPFIMTHKTPGIRLVTTAIAAVLALASIQLIAQTAPEPMTVAPAFAVPDIAPAAATPIEPLATSVSDPIVLEPTITTTKSRKAIATHRTTSEARPAKTAAVERAPVAAPVAAPVETVAAVLGPVAAAPRATPVVVRAVPTPPAQDASIMSSEMLQIAGAAGLGLVVLIGSGLALRRRKRRIEGELAAAEQAAVDEAPAEPDPLFAEPAFAAAPAPPTASAPAEFLPEGAEAAPAATPTDCVDAAPGSHVEAACDGPSADNPSLSIKKRLKRAHFFDEREQMAAAGMAVPVASDAGLPDAVVVPEPARRGRPPASPPDPRDRSIGERSRAPGPE